MATATGKTTKNRRILWGSLALAAAVLVGVVMLIIALPRTDMDFATEATTVFIRDSVDRPVDRTQTVSDDDLEAIKALFDGKLLYRDTPSCGFDEEISLRFNGTETFCVANDTCPVVYWKEKDCFFRLSETEQRQLYALLEPYGFYFPCI